MFPMYVRNSNQLPINNFYSEYDVCDPKTFTKELCAQYPSWQQCGCPLRAGEVKLNFNYPLPDLGVMGTIMAVSMLIILVQ
jgi:hypothetical protein